jgi:hypothetical protein
MDENSLKVLLARGLSVEQIGRRFQRDPSTVAYWMRKYGLVAPNREKYAPKGESTVVFWKASLMRAVPSPRSLRSWA